MHYSTEEFSTSQSKISSLFDALEDAYRLAVLSNWEYVCTLARHKCVTSDMLRNLDRLENARFVLEAYEKMANNFRADELVEEADALLADSAPMPHLCD
jgi:hypothetical protein